MSSSRRLRAAGPRIAPEAVLRPSAGTERRLGGALVVASVVFLACVVAMVVAMAVASPASTLLDQLVADPDLLAYRAPFIPASLLAPAFVTVLVLLLWVRGEGVGAREALALLALPVYVACCSIAYVSQYVALPRLIRLGLAEAEVWYFQDTHSVPYVLDLLGYAFLGVAACLLGIGFLDRDRTWRWLGWFLLVCGGASVAAFGALAFGAEALTSVLTWTSAVLTVPVAGLAIALGLRLRRPHPPALDIEHADLWA